MKVSKRDVVQCPVCGHAMVGRIDDPYVYKPWGVQDAPVEVARCKAVVIRPMRGRKGEGRRYQCLRRATLDGWCWQHHPPEGVMGVVEGQRIVERGR